MGIYTYIRNMVLILAYVIFGLIVGLFYDQLLLDNIYTLSILSILVIFIIFGLIINIVIKYQKKHNIKVK